VAGRFVVGTSGFSYNHWVDGVFYPSGLPAKQWLAYYASVFATVELNAPFYRLPSNASWTRWAESVPSGFSFAVKGSRYITHTKRLRDCREPLARFIKGGAGLGAKLAIVLWQLPQTFPADTARLDSFCRELGQITPSQARHAFEFRQASWLTEATYETLRRHNVALVIADSDRWTVANEVTADLVYLRFHGRPRYASDYPEPVLRDWAEKIRAWLDGGLNVYAYFNNDAHAFAVKDALFLKGLI